MNRSEWAEYDLREVGTFVGGATPSTTKAEYWDGDIPWTTSKSLGTKIALTTGERKITRSGLDNSSTSIVPAESLLIGTRVGVGKVVVTKIPIAINQDLTGLIVNRDRFDPTFVAFSLRSTKPQEEFTRRARGTTIRGLPREELATIRITAPSLEQQRLIGALLQSLEECIGAQREFFEL